MAFYENERDRVEREARESEQEATKKMKLAGVDRRIAEKEKELEKEKLERKKLRGY